MLFRGVRGVSVALLAARGRAVGVLAAVVGLCGLWAVALPGSASALPLGCVQSGSAVTCTFSETGGSQSWTVPSGVSSASFVVDGASGGASSDASEAGGLGGQVSATLGSLSAGEVFTIEVGGTAPKGGQGFNGGGSGGAGGAGGGGGFSSVYLGSTPELVAGGGGGGAQDVTDNACTATETTKSGSGGAAGGASGLDGSTGGTYTCSLETLGGGGGGNAGGDQLPLVAGGGGAAGQPSGTSNDSCGSGQGYAAGSQGSSTSDSTGGNGATGNGPVTVEGSGGGGGGGYPLGGGGGGSSAHESPCAMRGGGGGGGGGSSYAASTASGVLFSPTGVSVPGASGNGQVTITYTPQVLTPPKATPLITTTPSASPVEVGQSISDSATVTGGDSPSGTVTFDLFANDSCSGTAAFTSSNRPLSGGNALSTSLTATMAGTFHWVAIYNGDANNNSVSTSCSGETVTVLAQNTPPITTPTITTATITAATISSKHHRATFTFNASGASGFECALVKQPTGKHEKQPQPRYGACTSPTAYKHLKPGRYTFYVRTISVGAVNGPPATKHFRIR